MTTENNKTINKYQVSDHIFCIKSNRNRHIKSQGNVLFGDDIDDDGGVTKNLESKVSK